MSFAPRAGTPARSGGSSGDADPEQIVHVDDANRPVVLDVRCDPEEACFPMMPAGAAAVDILEAPDEEGAVR